MGPRSVSSPRARAQPRAVAKSAAATPGSFTDS
jgi:hypothetical protein